MENWKRLGLPLILGFAAGVINWYTVSMKIKPRTYVAVSRAIDVGDTLRRDMLEPIEISGDSRLARSAVPSSQVAILIGQRASRRLQKGDIVLRRDFVQGRNPLDLREGQRAVPIDVDGVYVPNHVYVGDYVSFATKPMDGSDGLAEKSSYEEELGPFRVLAIGNQLIRDTEQVARREVSKLTLLVHIDGRDAIQAEELNKAVEERRVLSINIWNERDGRASDLAASFTSDRLTQAQ